MRRFIVECRAPSGALDFTGPQPSDVFGRVIFSCGVSEDTMAKAVRRRRPEAVLDGRDVIHWPSKIDERWVARQKSW